MAASEKTAKPAKDDDNKKEQLPMPPVLKEPIFFDYCSFSQQKTIDLAKGTYDDRLKASIPVSKISSKEILAKSPLSFWGHVATTCVLTIGVPVGIFNIPILLFLFGRFVLGNVGLAFKGFGLFVFLPLLLIPQKFQPWVLQSWLAHKMMGYFSWRYILEEFPNPNRPRILVAPPHGVFPYGNLLSVICHPSVAGIYCRGLAARTAVSVPIFKQTLRSIGVVDANRVTARRVLEKPACLGISTGGVAEIFETNNDDEVILLRERIGLIKLAIRTGADLSPCYIFGNTKILDCWTGEGIPGGRNLLSKISRKLGFGLIFIYGRFGLPIPHRVPSLGVAGKAIPTHQIQCEDPTKEQIEEIQEQLIKAMQELFDNYKHLYGWENKRLIIK